VLVGVREVDLAIPIEVRRRGDPDREIRTRVTCDRWGEIRTRVICGEIRTGEIRGRSGPGLPAIDERAPPRPVLRGLSSRAPYFHNGLAADLDAAVQFYDDRFHIGFTAQDKADLVAFLRSL
jgi:hypothetical protein